MNKEKVHKNNLKKLSLHKMLGSPDPDAWKYYKSTKCFVDKYKWFKSTGSFAFGGVASNIDVLQKAAFLV